MKASIPILSQTVSIDESDDDKMEKDGIGRCPLRQKFQPEQGRLFIIIRIKEREKINKKIN
jgi:hypothetical protein